MKLISLIRRKVNSIAPCMLSTTTSTTTTLLGVSFSGGSTMNHYEGDNFLNLMSESGLLPDLSFAVDIFGGNNDINVLSTQSQARSVTDFCTKVMRSILKRQELKGNMVGTKKEN